MRSLKTVQSGRWARPRHHRSVTLGFTLVELLIVIAIIAIIASIVMGSMSIVARKKDETDTVASIAMISQALDNYRLDGGGLPARGKKHDPERNDFPELWKKLMEGTDQYLGNVSRQRIAIADEEADEGYRRATRREVDDPDTPKYLLDAWGNPFIYRCNKNLPPEESMLNSRNFDLYSMGPNGIDEVILGSEEDSESEEESDDFTN